MTPDTAMTLAKGDWVYSPAEDQFKLTGGVDRRPRQITEVWANKTKTIVRIRIASFGSRMASDWMSAEGFERCDPPAYAKKKGRTTARGGD